MRKVVLSVLLLAAVATSASAEIFPGRDGKYYSGPDEGQYYSCDYENYSGAAKDPGYSRWVFDIFYDGTGKPMLRGTEHFLTRSGQPAWDGYKATWAWPRILQEPGIPLTYTEWEYTFNPYGPQCKKVGVHFSANILRFSECGDGHTRSCYLVQ